MKGDCTLNIYAVLADCVVAIHVGYISYVLFGQLAILIGWPLRWQWIRNPWFRVSHLTMILIVALESMVQFECPLSTWEVNLRAQAGQVKWHDNEEEEKDDAGYDIENEGFIARALHNVLFCPDAGPILRIGYYSFAGLVVATIFLVPPRFRKLPKPAAFPTNG